MFFWEFLVLGILEFIEIASVALLPRNDGILEFSVMRSSGQAGDDKKRKSEDDTVGNSRLRNSSLRILDLEF